MRVRKQDREETKKPTVTNIKITCGTCSKSFKGKSTRVKTKFITDDVQKIYNKCPYCKAEFIIGYRDSETRKNVSEIMEIIEKIKKGYSEISEEVSNKLYKRFKELENSNIEISDRYKSMYEGVLE